MNITDDCDGLARRDRRLRQPLDRLVAVRSNSISDHVQEHPLGVTRLPGRPVQGLDLMYSPRRSVRLVSLVGSVFLACSGAMSQPGGLKAAELELTFQTRDAATGAIRRTA